MDPIPALTKAKENYLMTFCRKLLKCGFPINSEDLFNIVQNRRQENPFIDDRLGFYRFDGFMWQLTERVTERLTGGKAEKNDNIKK